MLIEDFFDNDSFVEIQKEVASTNLDARQCVQGDTLTQRIMLDSSNRDVLPASHKLISDKRYLNIMKYTSSHNQTPIFYIQFIKNGFNQGQPDPQKVLHSDTFHPSMKAWFFLEDVPLDNGPFTYIPESHKFSLKRMKWEYHKSQTVLQQPDGYSEKGSLRLTDEDIVEMRLKPTKKIAFKANTLVVANTHGFHGRGKAVAGASRLEIWAYSRANPFLPLPSLGLPYWHDIENWIINHYLKYKDREAKQNGSRSSWHKISNGEFLKR